jgi:hypothetical protein
VRQQVRGFFIEASLSQSSGLCLMRLVLSVYDFASCSRRVVVGVLFVAIASSLSARSRQAGLLHSARASISFTNFSNILMRCLARREMVFPSVGRFLLAPTSALKVQDVCFAVNRAADRRCKVGPIDTIEQNTGRVIELHDFTLPALSPF